MILITQWLIEWQYLGNENGRLKRLINNISQEKTWTSLRKVNFQIETESLLKPVQNNSIRTNHIKASIDNTQQNSKFRLCGDRDEMINHIVNECSILEKKIQEKQENIISSDRKNYTGSENTERNLLRRCSLAITNCNAPTLLHKSPEKINYLMYLDDLKLFAKNENDLVIRI